MVKRTLILLTLIAAGSTWAARPDAVTTLQKNWEKDAQTLPFSAERGSRIWHQDGTNQNGQIRRCTTCHGEDLTQPGKHARSGKVIEPMALSANPERYQDAKKLRKWLKRNCKWTFGRECTAQEKGDILEFLTQQ